MENLKNSKLLSIVTFIFSLSVVMVVALPIANDLSNVLPMIILLAVTCFGIITLDMVVKRKICEYILSEIERKKYKHIQEFFDYMENDSTFNKNVLREDIPIYDTDQKNIGTQTVYSAISEKKYKFLRE